MRVSHPNQSAKVHLAERLRHYLPAPLHQRWQADELTPVLEHLQKVLSAVLTYLPRHVVKARLADPSATTVSGTFTRATLMFADISGFTAMSERLTQLGREGAEVVTDIVNDYFAAMLEIIAEHGGDLFKFGGDALLVSFFSQRGAEAHACRAALAMQQAMTRFAVIKRPEGTFNLRMKIGLGTGDLFLTSLGSSDQLEFTVMGPALGRMARAESLAQAGEVLVDRETWEGASAMFEAHEHSPGFYRLEGPTPDQKKGSAPHESGADGEATAVLVAADLRQRMALHSTVEEVRRQAQRARIEQVLQDLDALNPYLPVGILQRIVASPGQVMIEGEHRPVTVLFANFYGIDDIIKGLGPDRPDQLTAILNRHFATMQSIVHKYEGIVNKVDTYAVGYRIMALFGAPIAHEDDPARAVRTALEMQAAMEAFTDLSTSAGRFALKQRIGVNTGYVFAGNLGSTLRQEYSVMGDAVNLAARLMGVAAEGEVIVSQSTARQVEGLFAWQEREPVQVKGKRRPVPNFLITRRLAGREGQAAARRDFFGRHPELASARELLDAALAGRGAALDLSGERGIGKSRLVEELSAYASAQGMQVLHGEALSYGRNIPYLPWLDVLRALFGLREEASPQGRRDRLVGALQSLGLSDWGPIVGEVLGIDLPETALTASLDAQLRQQRFFDVVLQAVQEQARRTPTLLVLDDVQWADEVSLDLIAYVARNVSGSSLLFVLAHWPDMASIPWAGQESTHTLYLNELDQEPSLALAASVLGGEELSPALGKLILDRSQGNPLFVEEVAHALRAAGAIRLDEDQGAWVVAGSVDAEVVPTSLTGLILNRIDRLELSNRRLLQVASVVGVTFRAPVLERVYPYDDLNGSLGQRLDDLAWTGLTTLVPPEAYRFRQTLTQEVTYESLPFARRRELHVRVGEDIERHHAGDLAEHYAALARHFDEGRAFDKAFVYLVRVGHKARDEYANQQALDYYRRALEVAAELGPEAEVQAQTLDVLEAMGDVYSLISRYEQAVERFQEAIAHPLCTAQRHGDLLRKIAKTYEQQGQYDEALEYLDQGQQVLFQDEQSLEMARICNLSGWIYMRRSELKKAIDDCEWGLIVLDKLERKPAALAVEADLYNTLGTVYADLQSDYLEATQYYQRSTRLRQQANDLPGLARSYNNLARVAWAQGDLAGAGDYLQRSLKINQQIGDNYGLAFGYNNLGVVSYTIGDVEQAFDHYYTALALRQRIGDSYGVAQTCSNIGEANLSLKEYDEARHYLEQAAAAFEAIQSEGELPEVYWLLAQVELARDDTTSAVAYAERARRMAEATGNVELQGTAERVLARSQAQMGDVAQASQSFQSSIDLLQTSGNQIELARSHYEFGLLLTQQPNQEHSAREQLRRAADLFAAAGAEKEAAQARDALEQLET